MSRAKPSASKPAPKLAVVAGTFTMTRGHPCALEISFTPEQKTKSFPRLAYQHRILPVSHRQPWLDPDLLIRVRSIHKQFSNQRENRLFVFVSIHPQRKPLKQVHRKCPLQPTCDTR